METARQRGPEAAGEERAESRPAARLAALADIADEAAHEFKNLSAAIEGTLELLAADPTGRLTERRLARLRNAASRAEALAGGVVALARDRHEAASTFDVGPWLIAARPWLKQFLPEGVELAIEVPPQPVTVHADPARLRIVLTALLMNAEQAIAAVGHAGVSIVCDPFSRTFSINIADGGRGIESGAAVGPGGPTAAKRLLGARLGIAAAEVFAADFGGRVELASDPRKGTFASLVLPEAAPE